MKILTKKFIAAVIALSCLLSSIGMIASATTITEYTAEPAKYGWTTLIEDDFANGSKGSWDLRLRKGGKEQEIDPVEKALIVGSTDSTATDAEGLTKAFTPTDHTLVWTIDFKIEKGSNTLNIYGSGDVSNCITMTVNHDVIKYMLEDGSTHELIKGITSTDWQNLTLVLNVADNSISVFHNGFHKGEIPFRKTNVTKLKTLWIGTKGIATKNTYIRNVAVYDTGMSDFLELSGGLVNETFDTTISGNDIWKVEGDVTVADGMLVQKLSGKSSKALYTLADGVKDGEVKISYDFIITGDESAADQTRFVAVSGSSTFFSTVVSEGVFRTNGLDENVEFGKVTFGKKHHIEYILNMSEKKFTGKLDDNPTVSGPFRKTDVELTFDNGSIGYNAYVEEGKNLTHQVDNFRIEADVTSYGLLNLNVPENIKVSDSDELSGCNLGGKVEELLSQISTKTPGGVVSVVSSKGVTKQGSDILEGDDIVLVTNRTGQASRKYKILPKYVVSLRGLDISSDEFAELDSITIPGKATVRAIITNNGPEKESFILKGTVMGGDGSVISEILSDPVQIDTAVSGMVKLQMDIPDKLSDGAFKVELADKDGNMMSNVLNIKKDIKTSTECSMPNVFSNSMVLQRGQKANIFGLAPTGSKVTVQFAGQTKEALAENAEFLVQLDPMEANAQGQDLVVTVTGQDGQEIKKFTYTDVVVGDVFYGSGQSNMTHSTASNPVLLEDGKANDVWKNMRMFNVSQQYSVANRPSSNNEKWTVMNDSNFGQSSGVVYGTAASLRKLGVIDENVPVGVIKCGWGGSLIGPWVSPEVIEKNEALWDRYVEGWTHKYLFNFTDLYYTMAQAVVPYTCKAAIWYQGESDGEGSSTWYDEVAADMIEMMRQEFGYEIPYYVVQLPGYTPAAWLKLRLTQWEIMDKSENTYVVVTNDSGNPSDIHPTDKEIVGDHIARQMAATIYGRTDIAYRGPVYKSSSARDGGVEISFAHVNEGPHGPLASMAADGSLEGFELSEDGKTFKTAIAQIEGDKIFVKADGVTNPAYVRYACHNGQPLKSLCNDSNGVKLPAAPFSYKVGEVVEIGTVQTPPAAEQEKVFDDISKTDWFYENVMKAYKDGLMNGMSDTKFAPNMSVARGMLTTVIHRLEGEPETDVKEKFEDVQSGMWFAHSVKWAAENNIVTGISDNMFAPNNNVTREQMAVILHRYAKYKGKATDDALADTLTYSDTALIASWATDAVKWCYKNGIMAGNADGSFNPKGSVTRAELAAVLTRINFN